MMNKQYTAFETLQAIHQASDISLGVHIDELLVHDRNFLDNCTAGDRLLWVLYPHGTDIGYFSSKDDLDYVSKHFGHLKHECYHIYVRADGAIAARIDRLSPSPMLVVTPERLMPHQELKVA